MKVVVTEILIAIVAIAIVVKCKNDKLESRIEALYSRIEALDSRIGTLEQQFNTYVQNQVSFNLTVIENQQLTRYLLEDEIGVRRINKLMKEYIDDKNRRASGDAGK